MRTSNNVCYRIARKICLTAAIMATYTGIAFCTPNKINSFQELLTALKSGQSVKVIIHYSNCRLVIAGKDEKAPEAIGGMELKLFEYFDVGAVNNKKAFISSSENILISHPRYGYVYNYVKLRFFEDESVEIIARYLEPKTFEVKMDETFYTTINNIENDGAVYLYSD